MRWLELLAAFLSGGFAHLVLEGVLLRRVAKRQQQHDLSISFGAFGGRSRSPEQVDAQMRRKHGVGDGG